MTLIIYEADMSLRKAKKIFSKGMFNCIVPGVIRGNYKLKDNAEINDVWFYPNDLNADNIKLYDRAEFFKKS